MSCLIQRILTIKPAITYSSISFVRNGQDLTSSFQYSWSMDGACWTAWVSYEQYKMLAANLETDFYLRILFTGAIGKLYLGCVEVPITDYSVCMPPLRFGELACDNPNLFNPYVNLDCALLLQQQLADAIICMLGIPVYYFRTDPDKSSADFTFKEFTMHNVVDCKQLKLMIEDGQMPSSNPKLTELDFDWEVDWETELSKTQFARAFGDTVFPKARDFLYIPLMKRMWEVNAAYDEKKDGLMWRSTTWKLALVKYNDSTNVMNNEFEEAVDTFIGKTYEESFGHFEDLEQERQTGALQVAQPKFSATNLYNIFMEDAVRKAYTRNDASIVDKIYCHHNTVVARNIYKFKNANGCVTYQKGLCGESGAISLIVETAGHLGGDLGKEIAEFGPITIEVGYDNEDKSFRIGVEDLVSEIQPFSTYLVIYRWNRATQTKELLVFKHVHRKDFPVYLLKPEQFWFDIDNPTAELVGPYNNDYIVQEEQFCQIHSWPVLVSNIKLYVGNIGRDEIIKESLKYTTDDERCVFADLARPTNSGRGYDAK